jgi:hypothetical protein
MHHYGSYQAPLLEPTLLVIRFNTIHLLPSLASKLLPFEMFLGIKSSLTYHPVVVPRSSKLAWLTKVGGALR